MEHYVPILVFALVAISFPIIALVLAKLVRAGSPDPVKSDPYECGVEITSYAHDTRFSIRYYLVAVSFLIFELEAAFLFAWAVDYWDAGITATLGALVFILILLLGLIYEWRKGALS